MAFLQGFFLFFFDIMRNDGNLIPVSEGIYKSLTLR